MFLQHHGPHGVRDLAVQIRDPDATVADLCHALTPDRPVTSLTVDGRLLAPATPLDRSTVGHGSVIRRFDEPDPPSPDGSDQGPAVLVVGGLDTGRRHPVPRGVSILGRPTGRPTGGRTDLLAIHDPTVSRRQAILMRRGDEVLVRGADATNPTLLAGVPVDIETPWPVGVVLSVGSCRLRLVDAVPPVPGRDPLEGPPPWTLHRIADDEPEGEPEPVAVPGEPDRLPAVTPIGLAALVGSLALAIVLVLVLGNWMYALFAGFGPVLAVLSSVDGRRRRRVQRRRDGRRRREELERLRDDLIRRREQHRRSLVHRLPSAAAAVHLATGGPGGSEPDPSCWRRRADAADAHTVRLGRGSLPWTPPLPHPVARLAPDVADIVDRLGAIPGAPVPLTFEPGRPIALRGPIAACRAIARSLVLQAATLHGPADLRIALLLDRDGTGPWRWATWLPHTIGSGGSPMISTDAAEGDRIVEQLSSPGPRHVVVIDDRDGLALRRGPTRTALRTGSDPESAIAVIVLVGDGRIPAGCLGVKVSESGTVRVPDLGGPIAGDGISIDVAATAAHALSRAFDPEVDDDSRTLPETVDLIDLIGPERLDERAVSARWRAGGADPPPHAVLGVGPDGPVSIDLAADGPHALIAGTTGSGKSELLRSLVLSLAIGSSPDHLCFVLIDFKGGSAFDACAHLPHTIGVVSDLDDHLADRALRCLEAELRHRERRLRDAEVSDITGFRRLPPDPSREPLPRLVVVIDEFATLAAELPDFVDALVGIAQRGRSLGVHLVLATQRPSGAVNDNIRANTALRIALRVQDRADSVDVVGSPDAAGLPRNRPGRSVVRLGPGELLTVQTAYASGAGLTGDLDPVVVMPLGADTNAEAGPSSDSPSDLETLTDRLTRAWRSMGGRQPRDVWPPPLPESLPGPLPDLDPEPEALLIGLADDPDGQCHRPHRWRLDGALLTVGLPGSGSSSVLSAVVLAAASRWSASELHIHVIDGGEGALSALAALPQVGAVIVEEEEERQRRLLERLADHLAANLGAGASTTVRRLLVINGLGAFHDRWGDRHEGPWAILTDLVRRGTAGGIHVALAAEGVGRVPHQILTACRQRLILRLGDRSDHATFGIPPGAVPDLPHARAIDPAGPTLVQIPTPDRGLPSEVAALVDRGRADGGGPPPVGVLPSSFPLGALSSVDRPLATVGEDGSLSLLVGVSDVRLALARLVLPPAAHALVAGPPRSGRTTALATIAAAAATTGHPVWWVGAADRTPPGCEHRSPGELEETDEKRDPIVIAVDDAELLTDDPVLQRIVTERRPGRHVVAAARSDRIRGAWGSWLREVRVDRIGVLLDPDRDLDGDLLGVRLPRELPVAPRTGLGWLIGDPSGFAQIALPHIQ